MYESTSYGLYIGGELKVKGLTYTEVSSMILVLYQELGIRNAAGHVTDNEV